MEILVISCAVFIFTLIVSITGNAGKKQDKKELRLSVLGVKEKRQLYEALELSFFKRFISPEISKIRALIKKLSPKKNNNSEQLARSLRLAGIKMTPEEYSGATLLITIIITISGLLFAVFIKTSILMRVLCLIISVILVVLIPRYYLKSRISTRQKQIELQLPEVMDVLCVSLEAGLGFDAAVFKISERMKGSLIDELMILYREIQMGRPRREALKNLAECSDVTELKTFASAVSQGEQLGIPIKNILRVQSEKLRLDRKQKAQEKGMKAPIKMMLPMVAFVFPVIFIILLGPTIIQLTGAK